MTSGSLMKREFHVGFWKGPGGKFSWSTLLNLDIVERELDNAINNFMSKGIMDEELQSLKYRYKAAQFDNLSDLTHIAMFYVPRLALGISLDEIDISYSKINDVNLEDVNNTIHTIFSSNKLIGRLLPKGDDNENK